MIYHELGASGIRISALGFGAMRWHAEADCRAIIERGLDAGINYIDTSTGYVNGKSHIWVADAIRERRADIMFSTKTGYNQAPKADVFVRDLADRLKTLRLDYADMVQVWGIESMETLRAALAPDGTVTGARQAQRQGLIRHGIGFTFHGPPDVFQAAIDAEAFISATVSYNLLNRDQEPLLAYAAAHGVGTIIMNPLGGGILGMAERPELAFLRGPTSGTSYGALRFLLANANISTSIIGYSAVDEVDDSLHALASSEDLNESMRRALIKKVAEVPRPAGQLCTGCGYCKVCPEGFNPTKFMKTMRDFNMYIADSTRLVPWLVARYGSAAIARKALARCVACGQCEATCPQKLAIVDAIRQASAALEKEAS